MATQALLQIHRTRQLHATVPSSALENVGERAIAVCVRLMDGHLHNVFSPALDSSASCVIVAALVPNISSAIIIPSDNLSTLIEMECTTLATSVMQNSTVSLMIVSVEIRSPRTHVRPLFCGTRINELFNNTAKGSNCKNSTDHQSASSEILYPKNRCQKVESPHGSAPQSVNRLRSSLVSLVPADTPRFHRSSTCVSTATLFLNKQIVRSLHELLVVVLVKQMYVFCSSVTPL